MRILLLSLLSVPLLCDASDDDSLRQLDALANEVIALNITAGMAIAVVQGERVVYAKGFGVTDVEKPMPVTADTQFFIASTTKALTALAALMQEHRGRIDLQAPVSRYLPALKLAAGLDPREIRLMDLLTMSHGISDDGPVVIRTAYTGEFTTAQLLELAALHAPNPSGRAFSYGNLGYNLIGMALDPRQDDGWKPIVEREVLKPLRMTRTAAQVSRADGDALAKSHTLDDLGVRRVTYGKQDANMHAAGGHVSTVRDLARLLVMELNEGRIDGEEVFPAEVIRRSQTQQVSQDRRFGPIKRHGWGIGWDLGRYEGDLIVHRPGGFQGFTSHVSFMPERKVGVAVLVNAGGPAATAIQVVSAHAYDVVLGRNDLNQRHARIVEQVRELRARRVQNAVKRRESGKSGKDSELVDFVGDYCNTALGTIRVSRRLSGLLVTLGIMESAAVWLDPVQASFYTDLPSEEIVQFRRSAGAGPATGIHYLDTLFDRCR